MAVGAVDTSGHWRPASWISPDGYNWSAPSLAFPAVPAVGGSSGASVDAVSGAGSALVAVGGARSGATVARGATAVGGASAWSSTDGRTWTQLSLPRSAVAAAWHAGLVASDGATTVVADPDPGTPRVLVGAGAIGPPAVATFSTARPVHLAWTEASSSAAVWGAPRAQARPVGLLDTGGGLQLLVDVTSPGQLLGDDRTSVVVLTSVDGSAWTEVPTGTSFAGDWVAAVASARGAPGLGTGATGTGATGTGATGLVAVGSQSPTTRLLSAHQPEVVAWRAAAGADWVRAAPTGRSFGTGVLATAASAVTRLAGGELVAVGASAPAVAGRAEARATAPPQAGLPLAWTSPTGAVWTLAGALDGAATSGEAPTGVCNGPAGAVAVGSGRDLATVTAGGALSASVPGRAALAWTSRTAATWSRATVPAPLPGGVDTMVDCATVPLDASRPTGDTSGATPGVTGTGAGPGVPGAPVSAPQSAGLVAWGSSDATDGLARPALWSSTTGTSWRRQKVAAFTTAASLSLSDVALSGRSWIAVGGDSTVEETGSAGALGLWASEDAGATWARLDTSGAAWQAVTTASLDKVAWLGATAVVAGTVDGQLAVWVSSPLPR